VPKDTRKTKPNFYENGPYDSPYVGIPYYVTDPYKRNSYDGLEDIDKIIEVEWKKIEIERNRLVEEQARLDKDQKQLDKDKCEVQKERARLETLKKEIHDQKYKESDLAMMLDNP